MGIRHQLTEEVLIKYPEIELSYNLFKRSIEIYKRTKATMRAAPRIQFVISSTRIIKVENDTNWSSKIFTSK